MSEGPTILWQQLKGKKVKSNDGESLGDIDKISQNYILLESGRIKKEKFWVPKYYADTFDGETLWLLVDGEEIKSKFHYGNEPPAEQFQSDFEVFNTQHGSGKEWDPEKVNFAKGKSVGVPNKPTGSDTGYDNVRELKK
jgi:hypothetical protein